MIKAIKNFFIKEKRFECIVFNGKTMSYPHLTMKEVEAYRAKGWEVTVKEEIDIT